MPRYRMIVETAVMIVDENDKEVAYLKRMGTVAVALNGAQRGKIVEDKLQDLNAQVTTQAKQMLENEFQRRQQK